MLFMYCIAVESALIFDLICIMHTQDNVNLTKLKLTKTYLKMDQNSIIKNCTYAILRRKPI